MLVVLEVVEDVIQVGNVNGIIIQEVMVTLPKVVEAEVVLELVVAVEEEVVEVEAVEIGKARENLVEEEILGAKSMLMSQQFTMRTWRLTLASVE